MLPPCHGIYWEGVEGSDCTKDGGCSALDGCLEKFAKEKLVEYQKQLGDEATPEKLSDLASVRVEAVLLAINFQNNANIVPGKVETTPPEESVDPVAPPPPNLEEPVSPDPPEEDEEPETEPEPPVESPEPEPEIEAPTEEATTKPEEPEPEPPPKEKKKRRKRAKSEPVNPTVAEPAQSVTGSAKTNQTQSAKNVSVQGAKVRQWDPIYNKTRWQRERVRSPLIAQLTPGTKLMRKWKGVQTVTIVENGYYRYNEEKYPTLYSVVVAITGTKPSPKQKRKDGSRLNGSRQMTSWSAVRFFKLRQLMEGKADK